MNYQEAKSSKQAAMTALNNAKQSFENAKEDLQSAQADVGIAYENLTQTMAEQEAGDATQTDVDNARQAHKDAQKAVNDATVTVDAKAKSIQVFQDKKEQAVKQFKDVAFDHFKDVAEPLAQQMIDALDELDTVNDEVANFRKEIKESGLTPSQFIPTNFEKVSLPVKRLKYPKTIQQWKDEMNNKLENLKSQ